MGQRGENGGVGTAESGGRGRPEPWSDVEEPFPDADLRGLEQALERLLEYERSDWPTPEHHRYTERLGYLLHEVRRRLR